MSAVERSEQNISVNNLYKIAKALNVTASDLLDENLPIRLVEAKQK
ncbi:helix-turn-helix domain-containing protein [Tropicibacter sp. Alg240-R139]|nr:helix-turn-helix domain-containing protein [Tropicibacter sp. Alg240-R139]